MNEISKNSIDPEFGPYYVCFQPYLYWDHEPDTDLEKLWAEIPWLKDEHEKSLRVPRLDIETLPLASPELQTKYTKLMQDHFDGSPDRLWEELHDGLLMSGIDIDPISPDPMEKITLAMRIQLQHELEHPEESYDPSFDKDHVWFGIRHVQEVATWLAIRPKTDELLHNENASLKRRSKGELTTYDVALVALILRKNIITNAGACSFHAIRSFTEQCGGLVARPLTNLHIKAALQILEGLGFHQLLDPGSHAARRCNTYTLSHIGAIQDIFAVIDSGMPSGTA